MVLQEAKIFCFSIRQFWVCFYISKPPYYLPITDISVLICIKPFFLARLTQELCEFFCLHLSPVVCSQTFHILNIYSEASALIGTKLWRSDVYEVFYKSNSETAGPIETKLWWSGVCEVLYENVLIYHDLTKTWPPWTSLVFDYLKLQVQMIF